MSRNSGQRLFTCGVCLWLLAGVAVFTVDGPMARFSVSDMPGDVRRLIQLAEVYAHGLGVGMLLLTLWVLDRDRRPLVPRVACLAFLPGILANTCKLLVTRQRPHSFDIDAPASTSFIGIPGSFDLSELQSFPSGHTATAVGLALALSSLYPHGRCLFAVLAILAATQRVLFDAHFVSDTLAGAGLAFMVAACLRSWLFWDAKSRALR